MDDTMQAHDTERCLEGLALRVKGIGTVFEARGWEAESALLEGLDDNLSALRKRVRKRIEKIGPEDPEYARWHPSRRGDFLGVHSGTKFWPLDPNPDEVVPLDIAWPLAGRPRWNGHGNRWYSIAEHSIRVANLVRYFAEQERWDAELTDLAWTYGLLHDASEAYLPDLPRPVKRLIPEWPDIEARLQEAIHAAFGLGHVPPEVEVLIDRADATVLWLEVRELFTQQQSNGWGVELPAGVVVTPALEDAARGDDPDPYEEDEGRKRLAKALERMLLEIKEKAEAKRVKVPCCNCGKVPPGPTRFPNGNVLTFVAVRLPVPCAREPKCEGWNHELCAHCWTMSVGKYETAAPPEQAPVPKKKARASWANEQAVASTEPPEKVSRLLAESQETGTIDLEAKAKELGLASTPLRPGIEREVFSGELDARECVNDPTHATFPCNKGCPRYVCLECQSDRFCPACRRLEEEKAKAQP